MDEGVPKGTVSASTQVQNTYYGLPVVKAPHWRWLIVFYFFFGGLAGASSTLSVVADLFSRDRALARTARYVALAAYLPCPPLLILDLGRPERFLNMLRIVKFKSPMSLGSWAFSFAGVFITLQAGLQFLSDLLHRDILAGPRRAAGIAGLPFSMFLSGYTGVLLSATNIPLWWRAFPLLSPTFASSAFSTSLAAISIALGFGEERHESARKIARAEVICMGAELSFMTAALIRLGRIGRPLRSGKLGAIFWPVTYVGGVLIPLLLQLNGPMRGHSGSRRRRTATAVLTLTGGLSLRALMIFAGRESARRPEDYFALTGRRP